MNFSRHFSNKLFWISLVVFVGIYYYFYPPIYAFRDESDYLSMAYVFRQGTLWIEKTAVPVRSWILSQGHRVSDYPPGMSFLLLPWISLNWKCAFVLNFTFHLLGTFYFQKILRLFQIKNPEILSLLYLFFPISIFLSRTIMSDIPAAVLFLVGIYYYYKKCGKDWKTGLFWGISFWIRPTGIIFMLPFLIHALMEWKQKSSMLSLFATFAGMFGLYNLLLYGSFFVTGYSGDFTGMQNFSTRYFVEHFIFYMKSLVLSFPFLLLGPVLARKTRRVEMLVSIALGILFFSLYFYQDRFSSEFLTLIFGVRFLLPGLFLLLLFYAEVLESIFSKPFLSIPIAIVFCLTCFKIQYEHQKLLRLQEAMQKTLYRNTTDGSTLIYDDNSAELIQEVWGKRHYFAEKDLDYNLQQVLQQADFSKGVFLAKRNEGPERLNLSRIFPEKSELLENRFIIRRIAREGGLEIFQFHERH